MRDNHSSQREKIERQVPHMPVIKVMGLGGGGSNAVDRMIDFGISGVEFIVANTDQQALELSQAHHKIQLGPKLTKGLGAGGDPEVGRKAAEESESEIALALEGADMVFLTAGMGGGTGTGSIPVAARIAQDLGVGSIAVVTKPFAFEVGGRQRNAVEGLIELQPHVDTLITIPNERLINAVSKDTTLSEAFLLADDVLRQAVQSITELITEPGVINVDFAHIQRMMSLGGGALMSIGEAQGEEKAVKAVEQALYHPLLEDISLTNASGIIVNFTSGNDLTLADMGKALSELQRKIPADAELIFGTTTDETLQDQVHVNLVVTGLGATTFEEAFSSVSPQERAPEREPGEPQHAVTRREVQPQKDTRRDPLDVPAFMRRRAYSSFD